MKKKFLMFIVTSALLLGSAISPVQVFNTGIETVKAAHATVTGREAEITVYNYLTGTAGLNSAAACGIMANIYHESSFIAANLANTAEKRLEMTDEAYTQAVDDGTYTDFVYDQGAYGICMWQYWSLKEDLLTLAQKKGTSIGDLNTQLEFLWSSMTEKEKSTLRGIENTAEGAREAGKFFCDSYERPASSTSGTTRGETAAAKFWPVWGDSNAVGTGTSGYATGTYRVTATSLTIRKGPGTNYGSWGVLRTNDVVKITETEDRWGKFVYNGNEAWCSLAYCTRIDGDSSSSGQNDNAVSAPVTTPEKNEETTGGTKYEITASSLTVRTGAGTSYSRIGSLPRGTVVTVNEVTSNNWGKISYNGKTGYISMDYAKKVTAASGDTPVSTQPAETATNTVYEITASSLNVRSGAGTGYSKLGTLARGTKVTVLSISNNWGKINYNGKTGYISMDYAKKVTTTTQESSSTSANYKVTASTLSVRTGGSTSYTMIGELVNGTKVTVLSISNGWGKISYNGTTGWICMKYTVKI